MAIGNLNFLVQLREMRDSLTPVGQRLADYVLNNPQEVPGLSIKSLAKKSRTSDAAVMRFCKSMGFDGYREMIVSLSTLLGAMDEIQPTGEFQDIKPGDGLASIIKNISNSNRQSIDDTLGVLSEDSVERAVDLLSAARRIVFFGVEASGIVCMDANQKFNRINKTSFVYTDSHGQLTSAALMGPEDVAVLVSYSGLTVDILDTLDVLKERRVPAIAITRYSKNPLAAQADVVLYISTPEVTIRSGAMGSRIAMLNVVDILYCGVVGRDFARAERCLADTRKAMAVKKRL